MPLFVIMTQTRVDLDRDATTRTLSIGTVLRDAIDCKRASSEIKSDTSELSDGIGSR